jgi:hypothetical protein
MAKWVKMTMDFLSANLGFAVQYKGTYYLRITRENCIKNHKMAQTIMNCSSTTISQTVPANPFRTVQ